jgi:hypothetical protein
MFAEFLLLRYENARPWQSGMGKSQPKNPDMESKPGAPSVILILVAAIAVRLIDPNQCPKEPVMRATMFWLAILFS